MKYDYLKSNEKKSSSKYDKDTLKENNISPDINILLNRVKVNRINEFKKKLYFSAAASAGLIVFGFVIF